MGGLLSAVAKENCFVGIGSGNFPQIYLGNGRKFLYEIRRTTHLHAQRSLAELERGLSYRSAGDGRITSPATLL